ncbi:glycoside hydrolase 5 family protein [Solitalea canadensis]|uniref:mannan endo-1,4-beta-mannosidase n=1 Tax=Solitalea canadensis (strain ATCC 29591 / DSM 3403 / JCM 21819 / LMG 8368 / NBRC 15130 / NCIMB 12057 / USAM 9D) TaxID=929556 RepID=H8KUQ6_SOLCM|nr:cellulase family glycosylhydrolase [Solitalea canadensis]AFD07540.1 endo-beta-mannanase [Solitalea canadensis DSM 3403]
MKITLSGILLFTLLLFGSKTEAQSNFVSVKNHQFILNNKPYYYIGTNYWYGGLLALVKDKKHGKDRLRKELDFLKAHGVTNLRVLAGSEGKGLVNGVERVKPTLQAEQGQFDESLLEGLDFLLFEIGKRKMHAVLFLSNNWEWSGGFLQYLSWNKIITDSTMQRKLNWDDLRDNTSKFYSCQPCIEDYKKQVQLIVNRVNSYTKKAYRDDPAIMAWELANEPRPMRPTAVDAYKQWTSEMAVFIKSLDKNHLVTLGTEGIMGTEESAELFEEVHRPSQIDYLTLHIWPKNWSWFKGKEIEQGLDSVIAKTVRYIQTQKQIADKLNKPLVIEEFGLPRDQHSFDPTTTTAARDGYYSVVFTQWKNSVLQNHSIAGCNFWAFGGTARPVPHQEFWKEGDDFMGDPPQEEQGLNTVFDSDKSTWNIIKQFAVSPK